jgi:hypothetical protein
MLATNIAEKIVSLHAKENMSVSQIQYAT